MVQCTYADATNDTFSAKEANMCLRDTSPFSNLLRFPERLTLRLLMSYIYMVHLFLMFLDHTQRRSTVGRTPLDE